MLNDLFLRETRWCFHHHGGSKTCGLAIHLRIAHTHGSLVELLTPNPSREVWKTKAMHQVIEVAFDIRVCRKINSSRVMDTAALQCERLDISVRTVRLHLSWLVSRVASSRVSGISKQKLPNTFQFWAFFFEKISHILKSCSDMLLSRLSTCYGTISRDTVQLEDLLGHGCESMFARGGGRMVSIVTMCHVSCKQMLCCWQQHAPSGNCQDNVKTAHLMSQVLSSAVGWDVLICL